MDFTIKVKTTDDLVEIVIKLVKAERRFSAKPCDDGGWVISILNKYS